MRPTDEEQETTQGMAHPWLQAIKHMVPFSGKPTFVISSILVALVFWGLQELMQLGFKCPNHSDYNVRYSCMFLIGPPVTLTLLAALLTREWQICCPTFCSKVKCCCQGNGGSNRHRWCSADCCLYYLTNLFKICYYGCIWIVVVFLDGDCYSCMYGFRNETWNKPNEDYGKDDVGSSAEKENLKLETHSKIIGITLLLGLVVIACLLNFCRCCAKPYYQWEYQHFYEENMQEIIYEKLKADAQRNAKDDFKELMKNATPSLDNSEAEPTDESGNILPKTDAQRNAKELLENATPESVNSVDEQDDQSIRVSLIDRNKTVTKQQTWMLSKFWKDISSREINEPRYDKLQTIQEKEVNNT